MEFNADNFTFSIDLETAALYQLDFLKLVDQTPGLKTASYLRQSVYRYEKYWLPLAAEHPDEFLSAPVDIEWVWHCHMLSPRAYEKDCKAVVNTIVNHRLKEPGEYTNAMDRSEEIWDLQYGNEEPFYEHFDQPFDEERISKFKTKIGYNIVEAAMRQKDFLYQVSLPHYKDKMYLQGALLRYKKFLFMKQLLPSEFIVPCYDIDLIWHTHQLHPLEYGADTVKYIGNLFNHDDTTTDRSEGSKLNQADKKTRHHWKVIFKESFSRFGAMYRGKPPEGVLYRITTEDLDALTTRKAMVHIEEITLHFQGQRRYKRFKMHISIRDKNGATVLTFKRPPNIPKDATKIIWSKGAIDNSGNFLFDTKYSSDLKIVLLETSKRAFAWFRGPTVEIAETVYPFRGFVHRLRPTGDTFDLDISLSANIKLSMHVTLDPPVKGPIELYLEEGVYETATIPEHIQSMWGPVSLERLPVGKDNHCIVATHRLKLHQGSVEFTCRTIHSVPLMMSVIQVYFKDKMAAIGHLVASDQLPLPTQISDIGLTLNPRAGERAVLIKNFEGDWGLVTGKWTGFRKGVAGRKACRYQKGIVGIPGSPGTLTVSFYKFNTGKLSTHTLKYKGSNYTLKVESCEVNLMKGTFEVQPQSNEVAENLVLAFSVALLPVLCVPRPPGWKEGQRLTPSQTSRGNKVIETIPSNKMGLVLAAGLLWDTPSNHYIRSHFGIKACAMCGGGGCGGDEGDSAERGEGGDTETDCIVDFSGEFPHLAPGEDGGYTYACGDDTDDGGAMGGCGGCGGCGGDSGPGGCGAACYGSGGGGGHADSGGGGGNWDSGHSGGGWDHGSVGGGSVGGGSAGGGSCGGGCGGGCGGD